MNSKGIRLQMIVILLSVTSLCFSQGKDSLMLRNEISLGIGAPSTTSLMVAIGTSGKHDPGLEFHLQYLYNVNKCIGIGAMGALEFHGKGDEDKHDGLITINPVARFYWFNKRHFAMYSKLGAGILIGIENMNGVIPLFNIMPIGLEIGSRKWRGFTEILPIGSVGLFNAGIKYSF